MAAATASGGYASNGYHGNNIHAGAGLHVGGGAPGGRGYGSQDYYAKPDYNYAYSVKDPYSGVDIDARENRYGYQTQGSYGTTLADGRRQNVNYVVDKDSGFQANVEYYGVAQHPHTPINKGGYGGTHANLRASAIHGGAARGVIHGGAGYRGGAIHGGAGYRGGAIHGGAGYRGGAIHGGAGYRGGAIHGGAGYRGGAIHGGYRGGASFLRGGFRDAGFLGGSYGSYGGCSGYYC